MFLTVIHVLPDGYKSSFAKSTACFIMKYSPQQHVKMLLTEKQTGLCLRFMQPFHFALSVQINVSKGSNGSFPFEYQEKNIQINTKRLFCLLACIGISKQKSVHTHRPGKRFPYTAFGWCCLFNSIQKLLLSRVVNPWNEIIHR